ncbi:Crp/Fnr family transcriptional regulator [Paenibacillus sp. DMB5]|uniref:Crp/Fnr family transcriptional regulator n=1 Tax=Paenibacillus sp. DMB5 TaxID=1780103 RepID=UPI00076CA472|nr:Crp/Fnr family transcriptional regulator [Paenibacillus sp. DMB5]KUP23530.1 cAMP-binding protein [Paenibacillus sp. DMB5]
MPEHSCKNAAEPCTRKVPIFASLSGSELSRISAMIRHRKYAKGQALILEEQPTDTLFIIQQGQVKLSKMTPQGKEQILHVLSSGEFFGELNILSSEELSNFSAYALTETAICMLTRTDMEQLMAENPDITIKLLKTVAKRLAHTENLAQSLATKDPEIRIAHMILELGDKYGKPRGGGLAIKLPLSREELASYVGVTRETISRKFARFEDLGLIELVGNKQLIVKDRVSLEKYTV